MMRSGVPSEGEKANRQADVGEDDKGMDCDGSRSEDSDAEGSRTNESLDIARENGAKMNARRETGGQKKGGAWGNNSSLCVGWTRWLFFGLESGGRRVFVRRMD